MRPNQTDQDSLPPYEILDAIIELYVEDEKSVGEIIGEGFDGEVVRKVVRLIDLSEYKRKQAAPGIKVTSRAFGFGRRMPIAQGFDAKLESLRGDVVAALHENPKWRGGSGCARLPVSIFALAREVLMQAWWRVLRGVAPYKWTVVISMLCALGVGLSYASGVAVMLPVLKVFISAEGIHGWADRTLLEDRLHVTIADWETTRRQGKIGNQ